MTAEYRIYGKANCPFCDKAIKVFDDLDIPYDYMTIERDEHLNRLKELRPEVKTVPQIFRLDKGAEIDYIGGYEDLIYYFNQGEL